MTAHPDLRSATPLPTPDETSPLELRLIRYAGEWRRGPAGQLWVWNDLAAALGDEAADQTVAVFDGLLALFARYGTQSLGAHPSACPGLDFERLLAHLIATAAVGEREEAMMLALLLLRADQPCQAVDLAQRIGLAVLRAELRSSRQPASAGRHECAEKP